METWTPPQMETSAQLLITVSQHQTKMNEKTVFLYIETDLG